MFICGDLCFVGSFVIGTLCQDGFMYYCNVVCLLFCLLFLLLVWGCWFDELEYNIYQKQGKGVVYLCFYEKINFLLYRDIIILVMDELCWNVVVDG